MVRRMYLAVGLMLAMVCSSQAAEPSNLVETAKESGYTAWTTMVDTAGLKSRLQGITSDTPYTVFVFTDEAFQKLPSQQQADLKDKQQAWNTVAYLTARGNLTTDQMLAKSEVQSVAGAEYKLTISADDQRRPQVNETARITKSITCENGTIHVIDTFIPAPTAQPEVQPQR